MKVFDIQSASARRSQQWLRYPVLGAGMIVLAVALLYGHTLHVPFYLDDTRGLVENYRLRDLQAAFERLFSQRGLTNLTFALNYRLSGWSLPPLHLVNITLHAGCGLLVWRVLLRLIGGRALPLLGALLFVAHPLQTQAVTYLIQRATVLASFLFLLAFLLYLRSRDALGKGLPKISHSYSWPYFGAVLAGGCAVLAKEHTATLPLVLFVYDRLFPLPNRGSWTRSLPELLPFCTVPLFLGGGVLVSLMSGGDSRTFVYPLASLQHNDPLHYLTTQWSVIWIYLRLLFLPFGQALEHNYPIAADLLTLQSGIGLAGLLALGWGAWRLRRRTPLLAFGAAWFFLALAVESSVIPLDPLFEHRLYLPMLGGVLTLIAGAEAFRWQKEAVWGVFGLVVLVWAVLSWQRNALWNIPIGFYEENLRVAPDSERVVKNLAILYGKSGRSAEQWQILNETVTRYPSSYLLYGDLARLLVERGQLAQALALLETGIARAPEQAILYESAAEICKNAGDMQCAIDYLQRGAAVAQGNRGRLLNALGVYYSDGGASAEAEQAFRASLAIPASETDHAHIYMNMAREYYYHKQWRQVAAMLERVLELNPGDPEALERLGEMALRAGDRATAWRVADKLKWADPEAWHRMQTAMRSAGWQEGP